MSEIKNWDWLTEEKCITDIAEWQKIFPVIHEFTVSNDGEKISAVVEIENKKAVPCVNGKTWENTYERVWPLKFSPDDRLVCAALQNYEWTIVVDQKPWEEKYDFEVIFKCFLAFHSRYFIIKNSFRKLIPQSE